VRSLSPTRPRLASQWRTFQAFIPEPASDGFRDQHLSQHLAGTFAGKFVRGSSITSGWRKAMKVVFFREVLAGFDTRLGSSPRFAG
jgi:hypothetical protein